MQKIWPEVNGTRLSPIMDALNTSLMEYKLNSPLRKAHFFAQVRIETGPDFMFGEDFRYYSENSLKGTFKKYRDHPNWAHRDCYIKNIQAANVQNISNVAYSDRYGNGCPESGDGWKYRGRGLKQLTFRDNYFEFTQGHKKIWPGDVPVDFVQNPELLSQPKYCVRSGIWFWLSHRLYAIADRGASDDVVDEITKIINLYTKSYGARKSQFHRIYGIFSNS